VAESARGSCPYEQGTPWRAIAPAEREDWRRGNCYREADGKLIVYERLEDGTEAAEPFIRFKDEADLVSQVRSGRLEAIRHWRFCGNDDEVRVKDPETGKIVKPSAGDILQGLEAGDPIPAE